MEIAVVVAANRARKYTLVKYVIYPWIATAIHLPKSVHRAGAAESRAAQVNAHQFNGLGTASGSWFARGIWVAGLLLLDPRLCPWVAAETQGKADLLRAGVVVGPLSPQRRANTENDVAVAFRRNWFGLIFSVS
jgi:hypothetical protein